MRTTARMKTKKRKIGKKIPEKKAQEEKVLVAWETPKLIPSLPYSVCEELEEVDWSKNRRRFVGILLEILRILFMKMLF